MKKTSAPVSAYFNSHALLGFLYSITLQSLLLLVILYPTTVARAEGQHLASDVPGAATMPLPIVTAPVTSLAGPEGVVTPLDEGFESGTLGSFVESSSPTPGAPSWSAVNTATHTGAFSAFAPDINTVTDV